MIANKNEIVRQYRNALKTFVSICRDWEIEPVLMTQVILAQDSNIVLDQLPEKIEFIMPEKPMEDPAIIKLLYSFHHIFNDVIREVADKEGVELIDLKKEVPATDHKYLYDLYHYNDLGSEYVAKIISEHLQKFIEKKQSDDRTDSLETKVNITRSAKMEF